MSKKTKIHFPPGKSFFRLCKFSKELSDLPKQSEINFSADRVRFVTPTDMIMIAKSCLQRRRKQRDETHTFSGLKDLTYANNLGFSDALRLKGKPYQQGAFGGQNYIPISSIARKDLEESAEEKGVQLGDEIEARCLSLAAVVSQGRSEELRSALQRSFREIIRNSFEHGEANTVFFCAQHWPRLEKVELCIADRGIGVRSSLESGKYNIPENDLEALKFAIMPGVSSKAWKHKKKKSAQKTPWDNSGYGLFFAHHLFGNLGHFAIASGSNALYLNRDRFNEFECEINGTVVSLSLDLSCEQRIFDCLNDLSKKAHIIKNRLGVKSLDIASIDAYLKSND
ncbi:hypothetical protein J7443_23865 [Tropicibacter sp. R15_0]|uniref:hypothetical protein n=1 Tax=Tropicibacter sp. R15_0 TaxID=2821101 RepID=UPI001ADD5A11|nr:hypothetical protein [Tropicibacter sp. R15_0]MBO9468285.1 hypothetical protein [Tropicibacter sp. R15_0]